MEQSVPYPVQFSYPQSVQISKVYSAVPTMATVPNAIYQQSAFDQKGSLPANAYTLTTAGPQYAVAGSIPHPNVRNVIGQRLGQSKPMRDIHFYACNCPGSGSATYNIL